VFRLLRKGGVLVYAGKEGGGAPYDRAAAVAKAEAAFLALLNTFEGQDRHVSPNPSASYAPAIFEKEAEAEGCTKGQLHRAMSKLLKDNRIHVETFGPPSRRRLKLTPGPKPTSTEGETIQ